MGLASKNPDDEDVGSAFDSDDDDADFNFDTVAQQAVTAMQISGGGSSSSQRQLGELGLDVGLTADHLYLSSAGAGSGSLDTSAPPGVTKLNPRDFISRDGPAAAPEAVRKSSRDLRGMPVRPVHDQTLRLKEAKEAKDSKLAKWFGLPRRKMTPELEKELTVLRLRGSYDPKRFYKANDSKALPTHFVMATEIAGGMAAAGMAAPKEVKWNSGTSFLDTVMRDEKAQDFMWRKHGEVGARGEAGYNSGHGKPGAKGRKSLSATHRGGSWKKTKKN